jgi:hypothetical protein
MWRTILAIGVVATALALVVAAPAVAVTKVAPGHEEETVECAGLGTLTLSVQRSENFGAVQIVGQQGHLIPVAFEFQLLNLTQGTVIFSESAAVGNGNAHPNQATTTCSIVFFEGPASELELEPGEQLPPDVLPTDILRAEFTAIVIAKT